MEKFCAYPSFPTPKGHQSVPYMARKEPKGKTYYIQNIHLELHLEHTFRTYIQKLHFQLTLELHSFTPHPCTLIHAYPCPRLPLPTFTPTLLELHLEITFKTYIRITLELSARPHIRIFIPFYFKNFTNYNYIQNYIIITFRIMPIYALH